MCVGPGVLVGAQNPNDPAEPVMLELPTLDGTTNRLGRNLQHGRSTCNVQELGIRDADDWDGGCAHGLIGAGSNPDGIPHSGRGELLIDMQLLANLVLGPREEQQGMSKAPPPTVAGSCENLQARTPWGAARLRGGPRLEGGRRRIETAAEPERIRPSHTSRRRGLSVRIGVSSVSGPLRQPLRAKGHHNENGPRRRSGGATGRSCVSPGGESNSGPHPYHGCALPTELPGRCGAKRSDAPRGLTTAPGRCCVHAWWEQDSNLRRLSHLVYSQAPLATRVSHRDRRRVRARAEPLQTRQ